MFKKDEAMNNNDKDFIIIGAGQHARVVATILKTSGQSIRGFVDETYDDKHPEVILGHPLIGNLNYLSNVYTPFMPFTLALGLGDNDERARLFAMLAHAPHSYQFPIVKHTSAHIEYNATIDAGAVIACGAIIASGAVIKQGVIINTGAIVDHDCQIAEFSHICPGVRLAGGVEVGRHTQVGIGASVIEGVKIGAHCKVGAGSVVIADVPDGAVAVGVPAKVVDLVE